MVYVSVCHILRYGLEAVLRIRMRTHTCNSFKQTEHSRGGLSLQTLSSEERLRCAPFLTVLGTHCISRSFPLPPQSLPKSLWRLKSSLKSPSFTERERVHDLHPAPVVLAHESPSLNRRCCSIDNINRKYTSSVVHSCPLPAHTRFRVLVLTAHSSLCVLVAVRCW